jgi:hypothetical protein
MPRVFRADLACEQGVPMEIQIVKVMHYYDHMNMAVLLLTDSLLAGDQIHVVGMITDFMQPLAFMEIDHTSVLWAEAGDNVTITVNQPVQKGDVVNRVIDEERDAQAQIAWERERAYS